MAYVTLEDATGAMELLAFQRALDDGGGYLKENAALLVRGRISVRDEKEPQILVDSFRPLTDLDAPPGDRARQGGGQGPKKLYARLPSREDPALARIQLILQMFPGEDQLILCFADSKKRLAAACIAHRALVAELQEMLGEDNVVLKDGAQ